MGHRILLIEDDPTSAAVVEQGLLAAGYHVTVAVDGYRGLGLALTEAFDLILLDLGLPDIDGVSVCRRLRETWWWRRRCGGHSTRQYGPASRHRQYVQNVDT